MPAFTINTAETFAHLPRAPITEAIIQIRGRVVAPWDETPTFAQLKSALPDYPTSDSQRAFQQQFVFAPGASATPPVDLGWAGAAFRNSTNTQVVNFLRDAFSFSRLEPYETWSQFSAEALRLYTIHVEQGQLTEAQRIGLRFINQFEVPSDIFNLGDFFTQPLPVAHTELPLTRALFFHQDTFMVPDYPYGVTVTRTFQPASPAPTGDIIGPKLILDIDVFTSGPTQAAPAQVRARLEEMRWLKNKLFFGSLTPSTIDKFR